MILFSSLFNESDDYFFHYIENFLHFTGHYCHLIVNFPPGRPLPIKEPHSSGRIIVHNGSRQREKFGHTLLMGHVENYQQANISIGRPDYVCTTASNALFFRPFDPVAAIRAFDIPVRLNSVSLDALPDRWWWPRLKASPRAIEMLQRDWGFDTLLSHQIEGAFLPAEDWDRLSARAHDIDALAASFDPENRLTLEEILPGSMSRYAGSGRMATLCHMYWDRHPRFNGRVLAADMVDFDARQPPHICLMKWFDRDIDAPETTIACRSWGREVVALLRRSRSERRMTTLLAQKFAMDQLSKSIDDQLPFVPLPCLAGAAEDSLAERTLLRGQLTCDGARRALALGGRGQEIGYLTTIATGLALVVDIAASGDALTMRSRPARGGPADGGLQGHLYLKLSKIEGETVIRITWRGGDPSGEELVRLLFNWPDDPADRYAPIWYESVEQDRRVILLRRNGPVPDHAAYLGIPLFPELDLQMIIEECRPRWNDATHRS
jgi:hypothetical protein